MTSFAPCEAWPVRWTCQEVDTASPTATGSAVGAATQVLWALSGRRFGECAVKLRPCRRECTDAPWPGGWREWPGVVGWPSPVLEGGLWFNVTCGSCRGSCSCTRMSEVVLPAPVSSITEVKVDGVVLPVTGAYRIDDNRLLVRLGGARWPSCQNLNLDDTQVGTWSVTARYGEPVPELGQLAVGEVACEFLRALRGEDCRLPKQVTQLARQGVTITLPDTTTAFGRGLIGTYLADLFIQTFNPGHLPVASQVYRVDGPVHRRVAT